MWIKDENEVNDIGYMYILRTIPMLHLLGTPQYVMEEPFHLEKNDDNYE